MKQDILKQLLEEFLGEDNPTVWQLLADILGTLNNVSDSYLDISKRITEEGLNRYQWETKENNNFDVQVSRNIVLQLVAKYAWQDKRDIALQLFNKDSIMPPSYRKVVYKILLKTGNKEDYQKMRHLFDTFENNALKKEILTTIGATTDQESKIDILDWSTSGEIKMQDFFYPVASLAGQNSENRLLVWQYFKDNFDKIFKLVETGSPFLFSAIISASASGFTTKEKANEIESFSKNILLKEVPVR